MNHSLFPLRRIAHGAWTFIGAKGQLFASRETAERIRRSHREPLPRLREKSRTEG